MLSCALFGVVLPLATTYPTATMEEWLGQENAATAMFVWQWAWIGIGRAGRMIAIEFCFTASACISNNATTSRDRGSYIGLQQTVSCIGRMAGPLLAGPLFAWSLLAADGDGGGVTAAARARFPFNHFFVFLLLGALSVVCSAIAFLMPRSLQRPYGT